MPKDWSARRSVSSRHLSSDQGGWNYDRREGPSTRPEYPSFSILTTSNANLRWDRPEEGLEPVLILGEENVVHQKRLEEIALEQPLLQATERTKGAERSKLEKGLEKKLTDEARRIKQTLWADRNDTFERPQLVKAIEELGGNYRSKLLEDTRFSEENTKFAARPTDALAKVGIPRPCFDLPEVSADVLVTTPTGRAIRRLQDNPDLNIWAKRGWELHPHRAGEECAFCGNNLSQGRIQLLEGHFSAEYQKQLGELLKLKERHETARTLLANAGAVQFNRGNFYGHLSEEGGGMSRRISRCYSSRA